MNTFLCVISKTNARAAPKTSDRVQAANTPLRPLNPTFSNSKGTTNIRGIRKITCRERLVIIAIHGLSMLWKKLEFTIVKAMSGDITDSRGSPTSRISSRVLSLVKALEMRRGIEHPKMEDSMPIDTHTNIVRENTFFSRSGWPAP